MARNISPFAALTNQEKQLKWMEYQTIRLPYTQVTNSDWNEPRSTQTSQSAESVGQEPPCNSTVEEKRIKTTSEPAPFPDTSANQMYQEAKRPIPPPEVFAIPQRNRYQSASGSQTQQQMHPTPSTYQQLNQKTQHRQYDAVIERMKQAEKRISSYQSWSK